jgi:hypothetical protein
MPALVSFASASGRSVVGAADREQIQKLGQKVVIKKSF